jgi:hypothetical protein
LKEREIEQLPNSHFNESALVILKNLPYAKRGYVFKTYYLVYFFKTRTWYIPTAKYKSSFSGLPKDEQAWIEKINTMKKSDKIDFYALLDEYEKSSNINQIGAEI